MNALWERLASTMTMEMPAITALMKKKMKIQGVYQSGWSLPGAMMKSDPSADWCIEENTTERIVSGSMILRSTERNRFSPSHSKVGSRNSRKRTDE